MVCTDFEKKSSQFTNKAITTDTAEDQKNNTTNVGD